MTREKSKHGSDKDPVVEKPADGKEPSAAQTLHRDTVIPPQPTNRASDRAAAAHVRNTTDTPHPVTLEVRQPDGSSKHISGTEFKQDGKTYIVSPDKQVYQADIAKDGTLRSVQPLTQDGQQIGKPMNVTAERTGSRPEQPQPARQESQKAAEPKSEGKPDIQKSVELRSEHKQESKPLEPQKQEIKDSLEGQKKLYESNKQSFDTQKQLFESQVAALSLPKPERPEPTTTKIEHVSVTPARPEFQRTSVSDVVPSKIERNLIPNTVEYGREFVNNRDTRQLFKPSLETTFQKPLEPVSAKPEVMQPFHQVGKLQPLQGLAEPFTFKPLKPINRADIIEQITDIGKGKNPFSVAALIPAILAIGRRPDVREPSAKVEPSKAIESVIKNPGLKPELKAVIGRMEQPQKDKLLDIATKVKENKAENLSPKDENIAKRIRQLEPKQLDVLIAWAQGKSPIKFENLHQDFQTKLSSIFETVVKATQVPGSIDSNSKESAGLKELKPTEAKPTEAKPIEKATEKAALVDKTKPVDELTSKVALKGSDTKPEEKTVQLKSEELPDDESDDTKPAQESEAADDVQTFSPIKKRKRQTKQMVEREVINQAEQNQLPSSKTTLLSNTARRTESGSLAEKYNIYIETLHEGKWRKVLECSAHENEALYIQHYLHKPDFKQSINVKIAELIQNNFFVHWQERINTFLGASQ